MHSFIFSDPAEAVIYIHEQRPSVFLCDAHQPGNSEWLRDRMNGGVAAYQGGTFGPTEGLWLVDEARKKVKDMRIILFSIENSGPVANELHLFGYCPKILGNLDVYARIAAACRLGPLRPEELDLGGTYRYPAMDLTSDAFNNYVEQYNRSRQERE